MECLLYWEFIWVFSNFLSVLSAHLGDDLSWIYLGSGHGEIKSLRQGYGENSRWMLKLSLDLPSPELILLQHGHPLFEISSVIRGLFVALAGFAAATELLWYPRGDTGRTKQLLSPSPNCWAEWAPPPGGIPSCCAGLELGRASVNQSGGWRGSILLQVAFPESILR